jgi:hypothetical protein
MHTMPSSLRSFLKITVATLGLATLLHASAPTVSDKPARPVKIIIQTDRQKLTATLEDNATAKAFAQFFPLELTLADYNRTEKISDLPKKLTTAGAPAGITPTTGDIAYYAPWGNLAIYYRDFPYSRCLVKLGRIDLGIEELRGDVPLKVRIEVAKDS